MTGRGPRPPRDHDAAVNRCRLPACPVVISAGRLMCKPHWYHVPKPLRDRIWATWQSGAGAFSPEYRQAVREAVAAVQARQAGEGQP